MITNHRGFTLVELIIVAAMVVILVVMTGSQLMAYNYQGANAIAAADLRNAIAAEQAFYAAWGVYASSAAGAAPGSGNTMTAYSSSTGLIAAFSIAPTAPSVTIPVPGFQIGVSQNVGVVINTSWNGTGYTIGSKNFSGDRCFGADSDTKEIFWVNGSMGRALGDGSSSVPASATGSNDFGGVAGGMNCDGNPSGAGQFSWTAL